MNKQVLEMLGLFTVPPDIKVRTKAQRDEDAMLVRDARDFFEDGQPTADGEGEMNKDGLKPQGAKGLFQDSADVKRAKDLQKKAERRERHL